ncbi:UNVERIFIED_CONTAM: hypothetical protein HDU68_012390 [Siphonaria sp. JEL0065]|nr:hypothetical protein HDU68_012390 [Siphonaria sp. JEL0065]
MPAIAIAQEPFLLSRYGGPVIQNIEVNPIFWGSNAHEQAIYKFYGAVVQSPWWSVLGQYGVQSGSIGNAYHAALTSHSLDDVNDVKPFLYNLVKKGILTPDLNGNSYYPIHLSPNVTASVSLFPGNVNPAHSCTGSTLGFKGYHASVNITDLNLGVPFLYYGVILDCGIKLQDIPAGWTNLDAITWVASHELTEAATDAEGDVGISLLYKYGLEAIPIAAQHVGWYDFDIANPAQSPGEVADLCEPVPGGKLPLVSTTGGDGHSYHVTPIWSNLVNKCVSK